MPHTWLLILLAVMPFAVTHAVQDGVDPKVAKELERKQQDLAKAEEKLKVVHATVQDLWASLSAAYENGKSLPDKVAVRDIERTFGDALSAALAGGKVDLKPQGRTAKAFEKEVPRALNRLEHAFLRAVPKTVRAAAEATFSDNLSGIDQMDRLRFAEQVYGRVFDSNRAFHEIWNTEISADHATVAAYVDAVNNIRKIDLDIKVLLDPKLIHTVGAPPGMAKIPGGNVTLEASFGYKRDKKKLVRLKAFYIDLHEVTHGDYYNKFWIHLSDAKQQAKLLPMTRDRKPFLWVMEQGTGLYRVPDELLNHPITGIDCDAALLYAKSQGKRLPTDGEWLAAAAASATKLDGLYPWGDRYLSEHCNDKAAGIGGTVPVDSYRVGRSIFGIYNLAGNVREWVATTDVDKDFVDTLPDGPNVVIRGGSFLSGTPDDVSNKWRWVTLPRATYEEDLGFRCAMDAD